MVWPRAIRTAGSMTAVQRTLLTLFVSVPRILPTVRIIPCPKVFPIRYTIPNSFSRDIQTLPCRVVIHTANLRYGDIHSKAQAAYIHDLALNPTDPATAAAPSSSAFDDTLVTYADSNRYGQLQRWQKPIGPLEMLTDCLHRYDFSTAQAVLIPSIPGHHKLDALETFVHWKLRNLLHNTPRHNSLLAKAALLYASYLPWAHFRKGSCAICKSPWTRVSANQPAPALAIGLSDGI